MWYSLAKYCTVLYFICSSTCGSLAHTVHALAIRFSAYEVQSSTVLYFICSSTGGSLALSVPHALVICFSVCVIQSSKVLYFICSSTGGSLAFTSYMIKCIMWCSSTLLYHML